VDDRLCPVDGNEIEVGMGETVHIPSLPCDEVVKELCSDSMMENGLEHATNATEAKELYQHLRASIQLQLRG
jgi:hypothetical protein